MPVPGRIAAHLHTCIRYPFAVAGFPSVSLVLSSDDGAPLAAAALITKEDLATGGRAWAADAEQTHIWCSAHGGLGLAAIRPVFALLSATAPLQGVRPVAQIGTPLSAVLRGSLIARTVAETPWGVCMQDRDRAADRSGTPTSMKLYNVTILVRLGLAAVDDAAYPLDKVSPAVRRACVLNEELEDSKGQQRLRLLRNSAKEERFGSGGVIGPTARMRELLSVILGQGCSKPLSVAAPSRMAAARQSEPHVIVLLSDSEDDDDRVQVVDEVRIGGTGL